MGRSSGFLFVLAVIVFLFVLPIYACSGCDVRKRSEKAACRGGDADKCLLVGDYYAAKADGIIGFAMSNGATATNYYFLACKAKSGTGCTKMRNQHYDSARDSSFEITDEADVLIAACAEHASARPADSDACRELWDFMDGVDWAQNRAAQKFDQLCNAGGAAACYWLGRMHGQNLGGLHNITEEVIPIYEKSCAAGVRVACKTAQEYRDVQAQRAAQGSGSGSGSAAPVNVGSDAAPN